MRKEKKKARESKIRNKSEDGSVAYWQIRQNRSDFTALFFCVSVRWPFGVLHYLWYRHIKRISSEWKIQTFVVFSPFLKMAAIRAVMAFLRALSSLSWLSSPLHHRFGWWDEMERWLKGSPYTFYTGWRHTTDQILSVDWNTLNWVYLLDFRFYFLSPLIFFIHRVFLTFPAKTFNSFF